jgi:phage terminase small subunit
MPILSNARHEAFALAIARGDGVSETYAALYPGERNATTLYGKANKLHARPEVRERIAEIKSQFATRTTITAQRVLEELAKIGFANYSDFLTIDDTGRTNVDVSKLSKDQMAAIAEMQIDTAPDGKQRVKVKLHDKRGALLDIGKHLGMFREKIEVSGPNGGAIETKSMVEVSLLDKEERNMLKAMLLAIAERKAEREAERNSVRVIEYEEQE